MSIEPRVVLAFGDWLTGYTEFLVSRAFKGTQKLSQFWFADGAPWNGPIWGLEIYFKST